MRLLAITDLHDNRPALDRIVAQAGAVDVVLLGGDLTDFGSPTDAQRLVARLAEGPAPVLAVAGNCDSAAIERRLAELGVSLFQRGVVIGDVGFHGLSAMPPWRYGMYEFSEEELARDLETGHGQISGAAWHVVLSHPPPRARQVDRTVKGENVGSTALRQFIDRVQPHLVVCGHIHEGRGVEYLGRTAVVNCGAAWADSYAVIEIGSPPAIELREAT